MPLFNKNIGESIRPGETIADYRERLKNNYNMIESQEEVDLGASMGKATYKGIKNGQLFKGIGLGYDRYPTQLSVFRIWLMGTKDIPANEAFSFHTNDPRFDTYIAEFSKWMYENRVKNDKNLPKLDDGEIEEHAINIYKMLNKATEKLKKIKLPDIDYTDVNQFEQHKEMLFNFGAMGVDFGQEVVSLTKSLKNGPKYASKAIGSMGAYGEMMDFWEGIAGLGRIFNTSYDATRFERNEQDEKNEITNVAIKRYYLKDINNSIKGKTIEEYVNNRKKDHIYDFTFAKLISDSEKVFTKKPVPDEVIDDYLSGKNNGFEEIFQKEIPQLKKDSLKSINELSDDLADNFALSLSVGGGLSEEITEVFEGNPSPDELLRRMKETGSGKKIEERINYSFYKLEESLDGASKLYGAAKISGLDRLRIDGKSPCELWGEKYSSIKDAYERDMLIKAELFKELYFGKSKVIAENYVISNNNKIVKSGAFDLSYSAKEIEDYKSFMAEVDSLHENFLKVKELFVKYQKNPGANFEGKKEEGSKYYRNMIAALKTCIAATDITQSGGSKAVILKAIQSYQKACAQYYKERKGLVTGPVTSKGIVRLGLAEDGMNNLMERYDRLNILSKGLKLDGGRFESTKKLSLRTIRNNIIKVEANRGRKVDKNEFLMDSVKTKPFYVNNKVAAAKAAERNKDYMNNPVFKKIKETYPKNYMSMWCKAMDGAEKLNDQMERAKSVSEINKRPVINKKHTKENKKQSESIRRGSF